MPLINEDEFNRPNDTFRPSPFRDVGAGMAFDPNTTGTEYAHSEVDNPEPEGFIAEGAIGAVHIEPGSIPITAFEASIRAPTAVSVLPTLPDALYPDGALVLFLPEGKLYRNYLGAWTRSTDAQDMTVGQVTADQIAAGSVGAVHIVTDGLTADVIRGGVLILRATSDFVQGIRVEDAAGNLISSWGPTGLKITDPADAARYVLLQAGVLSFTTDDGATFPSAITPDGINASAINFGSAPGGHNLVLNSSFELADFVAAASTLTFTDATKWALAVGAGDGRLLALDNMLEGNALTMNVAGYV